MKDVLKRVVIVGIFLVAIMAVLDYFSSREKEASTSKIQMSETGTIVEDKKEEPVKEVIIEKETDEIEIFSDSKARINTTLNFRAEPNQDSKALSMLQPETIVNVLAKIRNRVV